MAISLEDIKKNKKSKRLRHKFGAVRCERDGLKFPSKLERSYYDKLNTLVKSGEVLFFLRQVAFDLAGGVRYFCDFQVFWADGTVDFIDTKGKFTDISKLKVKQVEDLYPVEIKIVTKV